jgi:hypothetical protein
VIDRQKTPLKRLRALLRLEPGPKDTPPENSQSPIHVRRVASANGVTFRKRVYAARPDSVFWPVGRLPFRPSVFVLLTVIVAAVRRGKRKRSSSGVAALTGAVWTAAVPMPVNETNGRKGARQ